MSSDKGVAQMVPGPMAPGMHRGQRSSLCCLR